MERTRWKRKWTKKADSIGRKLYPTSPPPIRIEPIIPHLISQQAILTRGERKLWVHVLLAAMAMALGKGDYPKREIEAAQRWIRTRNYQIKGFDWICTHLDLPGSDIRIWLIKRIESRRHQRAVERIKEAMNG